MIEEILTHLRADAQTYQEKALECVKCGAVYKAKADAVRECITTIEHVRDWHRMGA